MNEKKKEPMKTPVKPSTAGTAAKKTASTTKPAENKPKSQSTPPKPK